MSMLPIRAVAVVCLIVGISVLVLPAGRAEEALANVALQSIKQSDLRRHVIALADDTLEGREAGSRGGRAAGHYLGLQFQRNQLTGGASPGSYYQVFGPGYRNILGLLEGSDPELKDEIVLVGAHYDHVGYGTQQNSYGPIGYIHNGADDNASGTAGLLELIQAFSMLPTRPRRSILFTLWDGEEKGLLGSKHWVGQPTVPLENVRVSLNMDMIGRLRNDRVEITGARTAAGFRELLSRQNRETNLLLEFTWIMRDDSDHYSFYERNIPVLMLHTGLHDNYHRPSDDIETLNNAGMEQVTRLMFGLIRSLADAPRLPAFRSKSRQETPEMQKLVERRLPPLPGRLGVTWNADATAGSGVRIMRVAAGSAAARAGLRSGDRILRFGGREIDGGDDLKRLTLVAPQHVPLVVERGGQSEPLTLNVELAGTPVRLGISWRHDDAEPGLIILSRVVPGSPASEAGLAVNDRVLEVGGATFSTDDEFRNLLLSGGGPVHLLVERNGRIREVSVEVLDAAMVSVAE